MLLAAVSAGLLVLGVISLRQMHTDTLPELSSAPVLEVQTEALGLSSQEVEQYITVPVENNLLDGVMGVWDVRSHSVPGLSTVDLYFEPGVTTLHARQLVEERLTNAFSLPNVAKPPQLIQPLSSTSRALMIGLNSSAMSPLQLSYLARWVVKPRLSGVPGVANVSIFGQQDRQIQVMVNPARLAAHHVTLQQIINTAGNSQLVSPLSYLEGSAPGTGGFLDGPNQRLEIRPVLPLGGANLAHVPLSDQPGKLALGSVTNVIESHQPLIGDALTKRGSGLVLLVQKLPSASVRGVTSGIERALSELRPALGNVSIETSFFKPASYTTNALHNLALALVIAAVLALVALVALLLEARAAMVAALSVALSLLASALILQALGYTLNALVVLGLLAASALVVDDAVSGTHEVVASVRRRAREGAHVPIQTVILEASQQLRSVLVYGSLIALLCVVPVFVANGLTATFLHPMVLAFALAVIASAVIACTITPALGMLVFEKGASRPHAGALVERINAGYERILARALAIPRGAIASVCVIGLAGWFALPFLSQPAPPRLKDRNLVVQWQGPTGASLPEMNRVTSRTLSTLRTLPSVADVAATLGRAVSADRIVDTNSGQLYVALKPSADYDSAVRAVRQVVSSVPGMSASVSTYQADVAAGVLTPGRHDATVRLYGEDYGTLHGLASRVQTLLGHVDGLGRSSVSMPAQQPNIEVAINDNAAHAAGVLPGDARRQASTLVSGLTVGNFFQSNAVFDTVVIGTPGVRDNVSDVRNLLIDTARGGHVTLDRVASVSVRPDPIDIQHEALSRYVDVTVPVEGSLGDAQNAIHQKLSHMSFPLNYHAEVVPAPPDSPTSHARFLSFVLAAAIGILLLLQAAFGSWRLAAMFALALPSALIGGLLVALVMGQANSLGADVGLLMVLAFAARQGMLQIAAIRGRHRDDGGPLSSSIVLGAVRGRLGLSLTATVVVAAALVPFALMGDIAGNEITHVTAWVALGGLVTATLLTDVLLPALYLALGPRKRIEIEAPEEDALERQPVPAASQRAS